jgi:hypothetical protein
MPKPTLRATRSIAFLDIPADDEPEEPVSYSLPSELTSEQSEIARKLKAVLRKARVDQQYMATFVPSEENEALS